MQDEFIFTLFIFGLMILSYVFGVAIGGLRSQKQKYNLGVWDGKKEIVDELIDLYINQWCKEERLSSWGIDDLENAIHDFIIEKGRELNNG